MKNHLKRNFKHCIDNLLMVSFLAFGCYKKTKKKDKKYEKKIMFDNDI